jgi:endonuclease/exonuclease/phosphatase family metal-dependent hydrolase
MVGTPTRAVRPARGAPAGRALAVVIVLVVTAALLAVAGPADAARRPAPKALRATPAQASLALRWHRVHHAPGYRVRWSTHRSMAGSHRLGTTRHRTTVGGLAPNTRYFVQVAVAARKGHGRRLGPWSSKVVRRTPPPPCPTTGDLGDPTPAPVTGDPSDLSIASFNIRTMNSDSTAPVEQRWRSRAGRVAALLLGGATTRNDATASPEIIALQEANQSYAKYAARCTNQMIDLRNRLNAAGVGRYEATSLDPSSSIGTRILFDTTRLRLVSAGSVLLAPSGTTHPHLAWGIFQQRQGGQHFFFGSVHLVPNEGTSSHLVRDAEWDRLIALLSDPALTQNLPVVLGGDFNSPRSGAGLNTSAQTHLQRMYDAGFGDTLLGDVTDPSSTSLTVADARPAETVNANCKSFNGFQITQYCESDDPHVTPRPDDPITPLGQQIDYLFASDTLPVKSWEMVLDLDLTDNWIGTIPSDHNLLRATVTLPGVTG